MSVLLPAEPGPLVETIVRLAAVLGTRAGFVAVEPNPSLAYKLAVGSSVPTPRDGLADSRRRARRAHDKWHEQVDTKIATIEWGTFLGAGHRAQIDLDAVRRSGAFAKVDQVSPTLAFLPLTANPLDDLTGTLEERLEAAGAVLGALMLDSRGVNIE